MTSLIPAKFSVPASLSLWVLPLGALIFAYAAPLQAMVWQWWSNNMYSYGFAIPAISLYLIWLRRETLRRLQPAPNLIAGGLAVLAGLAMLVAGRVGNILSLQELSLVVTVAGGVLLLLGMGFLKALWFPIAYLLFMIPIWENILDRLHLPFQLLSASLGISILQAAGIPAYRQDIFIELPHVTLEVAKVCSGVNYLIAVVAIGVPLAFVFLQGWARRILLVGFSVAIAILTNGVRVALIGALSYYGIITDLHGPFHVLQGIIVSIAGYAALFAGACVLSRAPLTSPIPSSPSPRSPGPSPRPRRAGIPSLAASLAILLVLAGAYVHLYRSVPVPTKKDITSIPTVIGPWRGADLSWDDVPYRELRPDIELSRRYEAPGEQPIRVYVGYYASQDQGRELINYKVKDFHSGASRARLDVPPPYPPVEVNTLIRPDRRTSTLIFFWYDLNGRIVADRYLAKAYGTWQGLARGISNGAVVIVASEVTSPADFPRARSSVQAFATEIFPILREHLP